MKTINSFNIKISDITQNKPSLSYEQPYTGLVKWELLKSPGKSSHAFQFTKRLSSINLEGDTLLQFQKLWDSICSTV